MVFRGSEYSNQVECPRCKAFIGKNCKVEKGSFRLYCPERLNLAHELFPVEVRIPRIKRTAVNSNSTRQCQLGSHATCSGMNGPKHGMRIPCGCQCHKSKEKNVQQKASGRTI